MGWIDRLFGRREQEAGVLYRVVVARAREPHWYAEGGVADTIDGRFDMIAAVLSLVLLRLEAEPGNEAAGVALAERFVDDMDPQLREIGIGDVLVGKHMGRMMGMLGGRLGAYREGLAAGSIDRALARNLYRDHPPAPEALAHVREGLLAFHRALAATPAAELVEGKLP
ncbi:ubiquinol-cytochrome C chaperone family protein [Sphingomonas sp. DT-204]|uniref:ubiquinol-cytochrome C chaperone family protein n=1 Tax=Sphingomonas sp. DT-204 TaxID=3396166 RepID=UPI003F1DB03E